MKKYWPLLAIVLILIAIIGMSQYAESTKHRHEESARQAKAAAVAKGDDRNATDNTDGAYEPPVWARYFTWPEGVGAWAVILTLLAIVWQSTETRVAAIATQNATEHLISSERAWILVTKLELTSGATDAPEGITQVFIQCAAKNHGRTPARVIGMNAIFAQGPIADPGNTWNEKLYQFDRGAKPKGVILPDKSTALHCAVPDFNMEPGMVIKGPAEAGVTHFVHGVIRYWDMFSETDRFTRFCFRHKGMNEVSVAGFYQVGGERYNQQT